MSQLAPVHYYQWNNSTVVLGDKKEGDALSFVNSTETKLKSGAELKVQQEKMTLLDVVVSVESRRSNKLGCLQKAADVFLKFLVWIGFKRFTSTTVLIHDTVERIRTIEKTSDGHSIFFLQKQMKTILDFFALVPKDEDFAKFLQQIEASGYQNIEHCFMYAGMLNPKFTQSKESNPQINPQKLEEAAFAFYQLFLVMAKEAITKKREKEAVFALAQLSALKPEDETIIVAFLRQCDPINGAQALTQLKLKDRVPLQIEMGQKILAKQVLTEADVKTISKLAHRVKDDDQTSTLAKGLIERCLKEKKYLSYAIDAVQFFYTKANIALLTLIQINTLLQIFDCAIEQNDLNSAKLAYASLKTLNPPDEVHERCAKAFLSKVNYKEAAEVMKGLLDTKKTPEFIATAEKIFDESMKAKNYPAALMLASFMSSASLCMAAQGAIITQKYETAKTLLSHVHEANFQDERSSLLDQLNRAAPDLFE